MSINKGLFSSQTDDWATPKDVYEQLNKEFRFNLDPCANPQNAKCEKYYTKNDDGLVQNWGGHNVFCNPPYGKEISKWVKKCYEESQKCGIVVMLIPARTDTKWFHEYIYNQAEIRFLKGRLKFGNAKNSAPFPSMVVIFNNKKYEHQQSDSARQSGQKPRNQGCERSKGGSVLTRYKRKVQRPQW